MGQRGESLKTTAPQINPYTGPPAPTQLGKKRHRTDQTRCLFQKAHNMPYETAQQPRRLVALGRQMTLSDLGMMHINLCHPLSVRPLGQETP
jgi:hypothetical protein